jgi:hypothetical protein
VVHWTLLPGIQQLLLIIIFLLIHVSSQIDPSTMDRCMLDPSINFVSFFSLLAFSILVS